MPKTQKAGIDPAFRLVLLLVYHRHSYRLKQFVVVLGFVTKFFLMTVRELWI